MLVERFKDEIVVSDILSNQDGVAGLLLRSFQVSARHTVPDLSSHFLMPHFFLRPGYSCTPHVALAAVACAFWICAPAVCVVTGSGHAG